MFFELRHSGRRECGGMDIRSGTSRKILQGNPAEMHRRIHPVMGREAVVHSQYLHESLQQKFSAVGAHVPGPDRIFFNHPAAAGFSPGIAAEIPKRPF
jgi:hypothetical protein